MIFAVNNDVPAKSVAEVIAWAKANPAKANFGGSGGSFRMVHALVKSKTGLPSEYITYRASNETVAALTSGEIAMTMVDAGPISGALKGGKVRGLAVSSAKRIPAYPNLPTMTESGIAGIEIELWMGLFAPAATPQPILAKLEAETNQVLKLADVVERLRNHEVEPVGAGAAAFNQRILAERAEWARIAKEYNIKFD
ncbi:MAG: tripartite tricarboxylate transporter substrate binding protein [Alphaproteobacteria bacterium]|nr:tripartite tricarboxylate transporter substrate binding protein [Alphaproteobacteria bacterium]